LAASASSTKTNQPARKGSVTLLPVLFLLLLCSIPAGACNFSKPAAVCHEAVSPGIKAIFAGYVEAIRHTDTYRD
jgi:hypothetical protein